MGDHGPIPKRSDQRRRRNKGPAVDTAPATVSVRQPRIRSDVDVRAKRWYHSLKRSGQAEFYTDSDWQTALVAAEVLDLFFTTSRATLLAEFNRMCTSLLVTEGDRRRARLELERVVPDEEGDANVKDIEEARRRIRARK
jgi:hypothetical protein